MGVPSSAPPPAGTVGVGQLFADAQLKTLWLGVSASVDPAQSVLVGDIVGLLQADTATLNSAKSYTDTGLAGKANTSHTHIIADVTGLQAALDANAAVLPTGVIVMWSGSLASIPAGWHLCDGTFTTPDLRDRFIVGAGNAYAVTATGGATSQTVTSGLAGGFTPTGTVGDTTLLTTQIPSHNHTLSDPGHAHAVYDPGHTHTYTTAVLTPGWAPGGAAVGPGTSNTGASVTNVSIYGNTTGVSIAAAGGGGSHTHTLTMAAVGGHTHSVTVNVLPPYYALAYIMKV